MSHRFSAWICYKLGLTWKEFSVNKSPVTKKACVRTAGMVCKFVPCLKWFLHDILEQQAYTYTHTHILTSHQGQSAKGRPRPSCKQVKNMAAEGIQKWTEVTEKSWKGDNGRRKKKEKKKQDVESERWLTLLPDIQPCAASHLHRSKDDLKICACVCFAFMKQQHREQAVCLLSLFAVITATRSDCCPN